VTSALENSGVLVCTGERVTGGIPWLTVRLGGIKQDKTVSEK